MDLVSDLVVVWRFYCPADLNADVEELLKKREKRASVAISMVLVLLGVDIISTAIHDLRKGEERLEESESIIVISVISLIVFGFLTVVKLRYSILLESSSLQKDGICTLIGTILSLGLLADAIIVRKDPSAWWFDPTVALGCAIAAVLIGMQAIIDARFSQKLPIFQPSWWFVSQGTSRGGKAAEEQGSFVAENEARANGGTEMPPTSSHAPPPLV